MADTYKKIDDNTVEISTTTPEVTNAANHNKAVLQTELDHVPDRKDEIQIQFDAVVEREAELIEILEVFN